MPMSIKDTGLFPAAPDLSMHPASMHEYVPDPPLWSDGLEKQRFIILPPGKKIDVSNPTQWVFPIGTTFIKTFFDDTGPGGKPRAIETRVIRREHDTGELFEYAYYLYQWNAQGTDATRIFKDMDGDPNVETPVMITINHMVDGKPLMVNGGTPFMHTLPSRAECGQCHDENANVASHFIGFDAMRLNSKFSATSTKTQLEEFIAANFFTAPPTAPAPITNPNPVLERIKRFVFGNCVHCHHNGGMVFDLSPNVFEMNTINVPVPPTQTVMPPKGYLRIYGGMPDLSVVYRQVKRVMLPMPTAAGANRLRPMPPIGVSDQAANQDVLADLVTWITSLPPPKK